MKSFEKWLTEEVEKTFSLQEVENPKILTDWLSADGVLTPAEEELFEKLRKRLIEKVNFWNEDELKFFFISEFLNQFDFNHNGTYSTFSQRTIAVETTDVHGNKMNLRGRIEWFVATGKQVPTQPFFFINEYKPQLKSQSDPLGQLLISMFATQQLNVAEMPLYGAYVVGKFWQFVTLDGKNYAVSESFDSTKPFVLTQIVKILKQRKKAIETYLGLI